MADQLTSDAAAFARSSHELLSLYRRLFPTAATATPPMVSKPAQQTPKKLQPIIVNQWSWEYRGFWILELFFGFLAVTQFLMGFAAGNGEQILHGVWCTLLLVALVVGFSLRRTKIELPPPRRSHDDIVAPEDSRAALNHFRIALSYFEDARDRAGMPLLTQASMALAKASALDPRITVTDEDGTTYTQDRFAGLLLFYESLLHEAEGDRYKFLALDYAVKLQIDRASYCHKEARDNRYKGLDAVRKALKYAPKLPAYLRQYANLQDKLGNGREAVRVINRALELAPDDLDTLRLHTEIHARQNTR